VLDEAVEEQAQGSEDVAPADAVTETAFVEDDSGFSDTAGRDEPSGSAAPQLADQVEEERLAEAPAPPPIPPEMEVTGLAEAAPSGRLEWSEDDEFSPFAERDPTAVRRRSPLIIIVVLLLVVAAVAAAFWMLAPPEWREKLGVASASETPLQLMMTHSDRQKLASGNELLAVSGRVINPTSKTQAVPPIRAELKSSTGQLVYSWTIPPPARSLPPGGSASFNSAELNVPPGAEELTVTLGDPKA
jgi:hypothetical protein